MSKEMGEQIDRVKNWKQFLHISDVMNSILNDYQDKLNDITTKIDSLEKIYHNLSHLKLKEYNILKGKRTQLIDCIEIIQKYYS